MHVTSSNQTPNKRIIKNMETESHFYSVNDLLNYGAPMDNEKHVLHIDTYKINDVVVRMKPEFVQVVEVRVTDEDDFDKVGWFEADYCHPHGIELRVDYSLLAEREEYYEKIANIW